MRPRDAHRKRAAVGKDARSKSSMGNGDRVRADVSSSFARTSSAAAGDGLEDDESARGSVAVAVHRPGLTTVRDLRLVEPSTRPRLGSRVVRRTGARARREARSIPRMDPESAA